MKAYARMAAISAATALLVGALTGCTIVNNDHGSMTPPDGGMMSPSTTTGASAADGMFAQMMIPHHEQAVEMSTLAETRASSPEIRELADEIKGAQQPEIDQMTAWLEEWGMPVMSGMDAMGEHGGHGMSGMLTDDQMQQLADAQGPEFDRLFAEFMILHHEGAIDMAEDVVDSKDPRVAALAAAIISTQAEEIAQLRAFLGSSANAAEGDASASPSVVALSTPLDHVHAAVHVDGRLLVGTHTGVVDVDPSSGQVSQRGASQDDFMSLAGSADLLVASGHPGAGSTLPDPVGLIRSTDGGEIWEAVSLTGELDFHALAVDGARVAGVSTTGEVLYSGDSGLSWTQVAASEPGALAFFGDRLWIADGGSLRSWAPGESHVASNSDVAALLVNASPGGDRLDVIEVDGTVLTSADGTMWQDVGSVPQVTALASSADAVLALTSTEIYSVPLN